MIADDHSRDVAMTTNFGSKLANHGLPSFFTTAIDNGLEYHNANARINNGDDHSTSYTRMMNFTPVTTKEFMTLVCVMGEGEGGKSTKIGTSIQLSQNVLE